MIYALITISEFWLPANAILCEWSSHLNDCLNIIHVGFGFVKTAAKFSGFFARRLYLFDTSSYNRKGKM